MEADSKYITFKNPLGLTPKQVSINKIELKINSIRNVRHKYADSYPTLIDSSESLLNQADGMETMLIYIKQHGDDFQACKDVMSGIVLSTIRKLKSKTDQSRLCDVLRGMATAVNIYRNENVQYLESLFETPLTKQA